MQNIPTKQEIEWMNDFPFEAIKKDPLNIRWIKKQTEKLCLKAIHYDPYAIKYVRERTLKMWIEAVKINLHLPEFVYIDEKFRVEVEQTCFALTMMGGESSDLA